MVFSKFFRVLKSHWFQFLKILCFLIIWYHYFIWKLCNKTDIFEVFWKEKKNFHCQHFRIFKSSHLMSSVLRVSHTCHTFFRISCTERWNIQGLIVPKKLIRKFKGIVHYFIRFPIPQQRIKAEKDFSYRKKNIQLEKNIFPRTSTLFTIKKILLFMKFKIILLLYYQEKSIIH